MMSSPIAIIGGSGLYHIEGLRNQRWQQVNSPFGTPSDDILLGTLDGQELAFLPRHGRGHRLSPSAINYRANIDALKRLGVRQMIAVSAVGSLREDIPPGRFVLVDQYIDRTFRREQSFFGAGCVAHVSMAHPVCRRLGAHICAAGDAAVIDLLARGTYVAIEGPQFSSLAESQLYRQWRCDVIGMTNMPEAKLAREAEMCYASVAMVTDYDCWHPEHDSVTVEQVIRVLNQNADQARNLIKAVVPILKTDDSDCACRHALDNAIITAADAMDRTCLEKLDAVAGRVLSKYLT